jgi:sulfur carrier protein
MTIRVNGVAQEIEGGFSVEDLLVRNKVEQPEMVSVQLNGAFVQRNRSGVTALKENDEIDFLYFMGGGA